LPERQRKGLLDELIELCKRVAERFSLGCP
jgi:hypothetical protein